jgi:hypothetical protein
MMRRKAKSGLHPSMQAMQLSRWRNLHFTVGACSLGQDWQSGIPDHLPALDQNEGIRSFRAIQTDVLKGMVSCDRLLDASTDAPAQASTSGKDHLAGLFRLAKSKLLKRTIDLWRAAVFTGLFLEPSPKLPPNRP